MNAADPLAELRGYHLPEAVSWWPPAPGWWILVLSLLAVLTALAVWLIGRRRRGAAIRRARRELRELESRWRQEGDALDYVRGLSRLLRRFALARFDRRRVAGLTGERWLVFLDEHGGGGRFRSPTGRLLVESAYRPDGDLPVRDVARLVTDWIESNRGRRT